jgi:DNA-binding beta-propeller fold protein YncE
MVGVISESANHGAGVAPDGSRIVSDEAESTLDVVDGKTFKVTGGPVGGHLNNMAVGRDGRRCMPESSRRQWR